MASVLQSFVMQGKRPQFGKGACELMTGLVVRFSDDDLLEWIKNRICGGGLQGPWKSSSGRTAPDDPESAAENPTVLTWRVAVFGDWGHGGAYGFSCYRGQASGRN